MHQPITNSWRTLEPRFAALRIKTMTNWRHKRFLEVYSEDQAIDYDVDFSKRLRAYAPEDVVLLQFPQYLAVLEEEEARRQSIARIRYRQERQELRIQYRQAELQYLEEQLLDESVALVDKREALKRKLMQLSLCQQATKKSRRSSSIDAPASVPRALVDSA